MSLMPFASCFVMRSAFQSLLLLSCNFTVLPMIRLFLPLSLSLYVLGLCTDIIWQSSIPFDCFSIRAFRGWKVIQSWSEQRGQERSIKCWKELGNHESVKERRNLQNRTFSSTALRSGCRVDPQLKVRCTACFYSWLIKNTLVLVSSPCSSLAHLLHRSFHLEISLHWFLDSELVEEFQESQSLEFQHQEELVQLVVNT